MDKPNPSPEIKMDAYIIMLHLRSQGWTNYRNTKTIELGTILWRNGAT